MELRYSYKMWNSFISCYDTDVIFNPEMTQMFDKTKETKKCHKGRFVATVYRCQFQSLLS